MGLEKPWGWAETRGSETGWPPAPHWAAPDQGSNGPWHPAPASGLLRWPRDMWPTCARQTSCPAGPELWVQTIEFLFSLSPQAGAGTGSGAWASLPGPQWAAPSLGKAGLGRRWWAPDAEVSRGRPRCHAPHPAPCALRPAREHTRSWVSPGPGQLAIRSPGVCPPRPPPAAVAPRSGDLRRTQGTQARWGLGAGLCTVGGGRSSHSCETWVLGGHWSGVLVYTAEGASWRGARGWRWPSVAGREQLGHRVRACERDGAHGRGCSRHPSPPCPGSPTRRPVGERRGRAGVPSQPRGGTALGQATPPSVAAGPPGGLRGGRTAGAVGRGLAGTSTGQEMAAPSHGS